MSVKTGAEIVNLHKEYEEKIQELSDAITKLEEYDYTKGVLYQQLEKLQDELKKLKDTRFQPLEAVVIHRSLLGGTG